MKKVARNLKFWAKFLLLFNLNERASGQAPCLRMARIRNTYTMFYQIDDSCRLVVRTCTNFYCIYNHKQQQEQAMLQWAITSAMHQYF